MKKNKLALLKLKIYAHCVSVRVWWAFWKISHTELLRAFWAFRYRSPRMAIWIMQFVAGFMMARSVSAECPEAFICSLGAWLILTNLAINK
jgi:hypothetical protein